MGAYEGAGINGAWPRQSASPQPAATSGVWTAAGSPARSPDGSVYLTNSPSDCTVNTSTPGLDYGTSNFLCNPSRIDGVSISNSSQGGGGIFLHGWNHNLEVSNTRIFGNHGTLTGGINVGNGETPPLYVNDGTLCGPGIAAPAPLCPPLTGVLPNAAIPFQLNTGARPPQRPCLTTRASATALFLRHAFGRGGVTNQRRCRQLPVGSQLGRRKLEHRRRRRCRAQRPELQRHDRSQLHPVQPEHRRDACRPTVAVWGFIGANGTRTLPNGNECNSAEVADCPPGLGDGHGCEPHDRFRT